MVGPTKHHRVVTSIDVNERRPSDQVLETEDNVDPMLLSHRFSDEASVSPTTKKALIARLGTQSKRNPNSKARNFTLKKTEA